MKVISTCFAACAVMLVLSVEFVPVNCSVNGGNNCAACTFLVSLSEQLAEINNETVVQGFERLCNFLPGSFKDPCKTFLELAVPVIEILVFEKIFTPDVTCHSLGICFTEPGYPECYLYPKPTQTIRHAIKKAFPDPLVWQIHKQKVSNLKSDICDLLPGLKGFCQTIEKKLETHFPVVDIDNDSFSSIETLRGSHFRGRDCDDFQKTIYPGKSPSDGDKTQDSNCNGIYGIDQKTGKTYEELYCSDVQNYGVAILGDSAAAHFHLPRDWFSAVEINLKAFEALPMIIADEIDWPQLSAVTGYTNSSLLKPWWTDSVYLRLRELNHCNHRDYQNIGVNGADSGSMNDSIQYSLSRSQKSDYPLMLVYSLIGNDVCNGHENTTKDMTLPADMKKRFRSTLEYLDTVLPAGSHVVATGLADGRILYDTLKNKIHPLGDWRHDVTYPMIYNYLDCLKTSPCAGWMSSNESLRNFTSERAANLSLAVKEVTETFKAKNFNVHYLNYDMVKLMKQWVDQGGKASDLIEPVDGFHPSQVANFLAAAYFWDEANTFFPEAFKKNPHNADIKKMFGDQGGY